jgi:2-polyprenyl-3-methyl-5-hydroxy-6-metoxy-1,4-benzoquinol methylase
MSRLETFMQRIAADTYPEPRTSGHDTITEKRAAEFAANLKPGATVLDVGCGQGPALEWFSKHGFKVNGVALNDADINHCRAQGFDVAYSDQNNLGVFPSSYDAIWARHVVEHSIAPYFTLHEFYVALVSGGMLYLEVPAPATSCRHESNVNHYSVLGHDMWMHLIQRTGFSLVEAVNINLQTGAGPDIYYSFICRKP